MNEENEVEKLPGEIDVIEEVLDETNTPHLVSWHHRAKGQVLTQQVLTQADGPTQATTSKWRLKESKKGGTK